MPQANTVSRCAASDQRKAAIGDIATRLGYPNATVTWIAGALLFVGRYERKDAATTHVDAIELCRMLVADFDESDPARIAVLLSDMGLNSSRDIGRIVYALVDAGLCQAGEKDSENDFDAIFDRDTADRFATEVLAVRPFDWPVLAKQAVMGVLLIAGVAVVEVGRRNQWGSSSAFVAGSIFGISWLLWRLRWPRPMRFGLSWNRLRPREPTSGA